MAELRSGQLGGVRISREAEPEDIKGHSVRESAQASRLVRTAAASPRTRKSFIRIVIEACDRAARPAFARPHALALFKQLNGGNLPTSIGQLTSTDLQHELNP